MSSTAVSLLIAILFSALPCLSAAEIPIVRGRVHTANHEVPQGLCVSLEEGSSNMRGAEVDVRMDGSFEFRDVPTGEYMLRVTDCRGVNIFQQSVTIQVQMAELEVRVPDRETHGGAKTKATVSVRELKHPPDKKAVRAFQSALRLSEAGKYDAAAGELENAIRISPDFSEAHTNLAVQYFRLGRYEESAAESARAIAIGGPQPLSLSNLATAQARLQRWDEAEKSARAALRLDTSSVQANLILGFILVNDPATRSEGIRNLEKAAPASAPARLFLERLRASN